MILMRGGNGTARVIIGTTEPKYDNPRELREGVWLEDNDLTNHVQRPLRKTFFNTREVHTVPPNFRVLHVVSTLRECYVKRFEHCIGMQALDNSNELDLGPFQAVFYRGKPYKADRGYKRGIVTDVVDGDTIKVVPVATNETVGPLAYIEFDTCFYADVEHSELIVSRDVVFGTRDIAGTRVEALSDQFGTVTWNHGEV